MLKNGLPFEKTYFVVKTNQESAKSTYFSTNIILTTRKVQRSFVGGWRLLAAEGVSPAQLDQITSHETWHN